MSVNSLLNVPQSKNDWDRWAFNHMQDHLEIIQAIKTQGGPDLLQYQLDPLDFNNAFAWLKRHKQTHNDMNGSLSLQSIDLSELDFNDPNAVQAWVYSNYEEHNNAHLKLAI